MLQIIPVRVEGPKGVAKTYALLDSGSTITVIDKKFAYHLGLHGDPVKMSVCGLWGGEKHSNCEKISFTIEGPFGKQIVGHALSIPDVTLPSQTLSSKITQQIGSRMYMKIEPYNNAKVLILISQNNWGLIHSLDSQAVEGTGLVVSRTLLGWVLHGYSDNGSNEIFTYNVQATICTTDCEHNDDQQELKELDKLIRQYFV